LLPYAFGGFPDHGERAVAGYALCPARRSAEVPYRLRSTQRVAQIFAVSRPRFQALAQILGKLNFFKLGENLQRILLNYVEKRSSTANATFKRAC
jgi:hypothetical protein